jgi:RNA 3'-terminal phosphate cyclase (ATP)
MSATVEIDGSLGEGGGQVLRTALALATLTGRAVRLTQIRAGRERPGLAPQHLACVRALAALCDAELEGAGLRSTELSFAPRAPARAGNYAFDVAESARGGSAGSATLVFQCVLLPLALAGEPSEVRVKGGTHVPWSPPYDYLAEVFLPAMERCGARVLSRLVAWGFYPVGRGQMSAQILPLPENGIEPLSIEARGALTRIHGRAVACNLPAHIADRMAKRARSLLTDLEVPCEVTPERVRGNGPGAGIFLTAEYEHAAAGFSALGERGRASERVAEEACAALVAHDEAGAPVDPHLADQLLLPMALARSRSSLRTSRVTRHLSTNAEVIRAFLPVAIAIDGEEGEPGEIEVRPGQ